MNVKSIFIFVLFAVNQCYSAHILALVLYGSKNHRTSLFPVLKELAQRGHNVTFVTPFKSAEEVQGLREIEIKNLLFASSKFNFNWFEINRINTVVMNVMLLKSLPVILEPILDLLMNNVELQEVLKNQQVNLVILDDSYHEFCLPLIDYLGAPFIMHSPSTGQPWTWNAIGASQELATSPVRFTSYNNEMVFRERLYNTILSVVLQFVRNFILIPNMDTINQKYFPNARPISVIEKEASLLFVAGKVESSWARLLPPTAIPLGALQVRAAQPLPQVVILVSIMSLPQQHSQ